jgi:hypothetical protein
VGDRRRVERCDPFAPAVGSGLVDGREWVDAREGLVTVGAWAGPFALSFGLASAASPLA